MNGQREKYNSIIKTMPEPVSLDDVRGGVRLREVCEYAAQKKTEVYKLSEEEKERFVIDK